MTNGSSTFIPIKRVKTEIFNEEVQTSGSYPCKFDCDDGNIYYVKHSPLGQRKRQLINELIAGLLTKELKINIPEFALVEINEELYSDTDIFRGGRPKGLGFGSQQLLGNSKNINQVKGLSPKDTVNENSISKTFLQIILFDIWVKNSDRTINNPNLLVEEINRHFRIVAIDHAEIFSGLNYAVLNLERDENVTLGDTLIPHDFFDAVHKHFGLFFMEEVQDIIKSINQIDEKKIISILNLVPAEWNLEKEEKESITNFLLVRKKNLFDNFNSLLLEAGY